MPILAWTLCKHGHVIFDHQMMVGRCAIDAAAFITFLMPRTNGRQISAATQNLGQHGLIADMHDDENRSIEFFWQALGKVTESFNSSAGSANDDDITFGHGGSRPS